MKLRPLSHRVTKTNRDPATPAANDSSSASTASGSEMVSATDPPRHLPTETWVEMLSARDKWRNALLSYHDLKRGRDLVGNLGGEEDADAAVP